MDKMQHLSAMDSAFLHLETAEMPMHVGSLHRYQLPDGYAGNWYDDVKQHLARRLHLSPVFTRKLALMPFDLANPVWIEDDDIDLDYHMRYTVLPKPGHAGAAARPWPHGCIPACSTAAGHCGSSMSSKAWPTARWASTARCTTRPSTARPAWRWATPCST